MPRCLDLLLWLWLSRRMTGRHLPLLVLLAAFLVLEFAYPRFPNEDTEIFFKSAGRNISQGGAFAAPELEGYLHLYRVPEIVTRGRFPDGGESDSTWRTQEARHVGSDTIAPGF
jgi:hypothetical protein